MSRLLLAAMLVFALLLVVSEAVFVVDETEQVIVTQLGEPKREIREPGVAFKLPFLQQARVFDNRFLEWNGDANELPTRDKRFLEVDTYARWRIVDPLAFFQRVQNEVGAQSRLDDIIDGATRDAVASHLLVEIVRTSNRDVLIDATLSEYEQVAGLSEVAVGRARVAEQILESARGRVAEAELGIEILDVRFKAINYNDRVREDVYQRMIAERNRIAERFRSEGEGESAKIRGEKERRLKEIESEAYREAQTIIGRAEAEATAIYANAYGRDAEFYEFVRTLQLYPETIDQDTWLVLNTDSRFWRYLRGPE